MDGLEIQYYHKVDDKALQIRMDYGFFEHNIDIYDLCEKLGYVLIKYSSLNKSQLTLIKDTYNLNDGLTINKRGIHYIFYNDCQIETRIRFTLAHEIDHSTDLIHPKEEYIEKVADHFARSLLIPQCILIYENYDDIYKVADDFNVSVSAALNALDAATRWKNHPNFKFTEKESEYLKLREKYCKQKEKRHFRE